MNNAAGIYVRVSSDSQDRADSTSLIEQERACRAHCERAGLNVVQVYRDVQSGLETNREGFQAMLADARAGRVNVVVAYKQDRLMREVYPAADLIAVMDGYGVTVQTAGEYFDADNYLMNLGYSRREIAIFKQRSRDGKVGAARAGRVPLAQSSLPFGYVKAADGSFEVDIEGAAIVRRIFEGYASEGLTVNEISADLERDTGKTWYATRIHRILSHPAYKGEYVFGKHVYRRVEGLPRRRFERPESEQVSIKIPAIVEPRLWGAGADA